MIGTWKGVLRAEEDIAKRGEERNRCIVCFMLAGDVARAGGQVHCSAGMTVIVFHQITIQHISLVS